MNAKRGKSRSLEGAVSYAVGHPTRVEILCLLNERSHSIQELSRALRLPISTVNHHVDELYEDGSIEVAHTRRVRNLTQSFYRVSEFLYLDDEEMAALPPETRQEIYGVILQASMAEALASYSAGKISDDPRTFLAWQWFNVDAQGRDDIANLQAECFDGCKEVEAASASRRAETGEEPRSIVVVSFGFERSRNNPDPPTHVQDRRDVR